MANPFFMVTVNVSTHSNALAVAILQATDGGGAAVNSGSTLYYVSCCPITAHSYTLLLDLVGVERELELPQCATDVLPLL